MNDQSTFRALVVREEDGSFQRAVEERRIADLPPGELLEEMTDFPASEQVISGLIYPTCMVLRYSKVE